MTRKHALPTTRLSSSKSGQTGFTLTELTIVVAILSLLAMLLIPVITGGIEGSRKAACLTNLKNISSTMTDKLMANNGERILPMIHSSGNPNDSSGTGLGYSNTLSSLGTNAMQNVWQMVMDYEVDWRNFLCPSDDTTERPGDYKYGWSALTEFSYGLQWPYGDDGEEEGATNPAPINSTTLKNRFAVMADRNPGGAVNGTTIKHSNHRDGVSVLYHDGNVRFYEADDSKAGYRGDDIYINGADPAVAGGVPTSETDTVITPCPSR